MQDLIGEFCPLVLCVDSLVVCSPFACMKKKCCDREFYSQRRMQKEPILTMRGDISPKF